MEELRRASCVRGHHLYKGIWNPVVGEVLQCEREPRIAADRYAVAMACEAMACEGSEHDSDPLGSGRPSFVLKYLLIDIDKTDN